MRLVAVELSLRGLYIPPVPNKMLGPNPPQMTISLLAACRYFATERWHLAERFTARPDTDAFNLLVILSGWGMIEWENDRAPFRQGECWFLPASLESYELIPEAECSLLRTYVPNLQALRRNLRGLGIGENKIAGVVFD